MARLLPHCVTVLIELLKRDMALKASQRFQQSVLLLLIDSVSYGTVYFRVKYLRHGLLLRAVRAVAVVLLIILCNAHYWQ